MGSTSRLKLLLDTHIWLWSVLSPAQLSPRVTSALDDQANELWLSPVSTWELLILVEKKRVILKKDPVRWIGDVLREVPLREAPLTHEVAIQSRVLPLLTHDPADRFLAATAKIYGFTLVTADEKLIASSGFPVFANG